jgi:gas vesicle protein
MRRSAFGRPLAAACVVAAALVTGCSTSSSSSSTSTSTSSSSNSVICSDIENLKASILGLKDVSITQNGLSAISDQITKIKQQLQTFQNNAKGQYAGEVSNLTNALNGLSSSFDAARASPSLSTMATLASSAKTAVTAGQQLINAVSSTC